MIRRRLGVAVVGVLFVVVAGIGLGLAAAGTGDPRLRRVGRVGSVAIDGQRSVGSDGP